MSGILINVDANTDKAQRDLAQVNESLKAIKGSTAKVTEGLSSMAKGFAAFAVTGAAAAYIASISNEFQNLSNQIKLVTDDTKEFTKIQSKLVDLSIRNRIEISATAKIYSTLSKNLANAAGSSDTLLTATEAIQKAVALSGSSAESATAAIIQLGQGLSSGTLRGEELNSVMEQTPRLAKAIAEGMGLTLAQMRALAAEGKVTANEVFGAILSQTQKLNTEFAKMTPTLAQATSGLHTAIKNVVNEFETGLGATNAMAAAMVKMSNGLGDASIEARALGGNLAYTVESTFHKLSQIGTPLVGLVTSVFSQVAKAMPRIDFTRTIFGDFMSGMRSIDDFTGGAFTRISHVLRFGLYDLITYDSAAEAALKKMKRLSPTNWLTGGFNVQTLNDFFDTKIIYAYGEAFKELAAAIGGNSDSIFVKVGEKVRRLQYTFRDLARYVGLLPDTFLTFRIGDIDAFNYSITELLRGVTGIQLKFTQVNKLIREIANTSTMRLQLALEDIAMAVPEAIIEAIKSIFEAVMATLPKVRQAVKDFIGGPIFELPDLKIKIPKIDLFSNLKMPDFSGNNAFVVFVKDAIDSVSSLKEKVVDSFNTIRKTIVNTFTNVRDNVNKTFDDMHSAIVDYVHQTTFLEKAANAVTSTTMLFAEIFGPLAVIPALLFNISVGMQNAFDPTIARRLRDALISLVAWIDDFSPKAARLISNFFNLQKGFVATFFEASVWLAFGRVFDAVATFVVANIAIITQKLGELGRVSIFSQYGDRIFGNLSQTIDAFAERLTKAYEKVKVFGKNVIRVFFEIWDEVVGHSWWPDTIDGVVNYSNNLSERVMPSLNKFQKNVNDIFSGLANNDYSFDVKEFAVNVKLNFVSIKDSVKEVINSIASEFPNLARGVVFGVAALLAYMLLPMNKAVTILLTDLALTAASNLSIFAEDLSENIFGASLAQNLGETIGTTVAGYMIEIVKALPGVINLVVTAAYGFGKAFIEGIAKSLPFGIGTLLGGITESLFRILDVTGLGGPLGVFAMFFFGRSSMAFFKSIGFFTKSIEAIEVFFAGFAKYFAGPQQGVIGRFLFGIGPAPIVAGIGLILGLAGSFDSLFGGSVLVKYGALGLMGYTMFGGNPVRIAAALYANVVTPFMGAITVMAGRSSSVLGSLFSSILGSRKGLLLLASALLFMRSSMASAMTDTDAVFKDSSTGFDRIKDTVVQVKDAIVEAAVESPTKAILATLAVATSGVLIGKFVNQIMVMKRTAADAAKAIIQTTRLDKAFSLGEKAFELLGTLMPTFGGGLKKVMDFMKAEWEKMAVVIAARWSIMVEALRYQWWLFANSSFAAPFITKLNVMYSAFTAWAGKIKAELVALAIRFKVFSTGLTLGIATGAATILGGGDWDNVIQNVMAVLSVFSMAGAKIQGMIAGWMGRLAVFVGGLLSASALVTAGITLVVGGILGVFFFGEGDTFMEKLDDAWHKMKRILGLSNEVRKNSFENKKREGMITADDRSLAKRFQLKDPPKLGGVNFDIINDREKSAIDGALNKYKKALDDASEEYAATGTVSEDLRNSIDKLGTNVQEIADRLAVKSTRNLPDSFKNLSQDAQSQDTGFWPRWNNWVDQIGLDMDYGFEAWGNKVARFFASDLPKKAKYTENLQKLADEKNTKYKAGWIDLAEPDSQMQKSLMTLKRPANIGNPSLGKEFEESYQTYRKQLFLVRDMTGYTDAQRDAERDKLSYMRLALQQLIKEVKAYEEREDAVTKFNNRLKYVSSTLKDIGIEVDQNQLLSGTNASFTNIEQMVDGLKEIDKMLNKSGTKAEGVATFEERVALMRRKMELTTQLLLDAQHQYDNTISTPQAAVARLSDSTGMGFDKVEVSKIGSGWSETLRTQLQGLESLKTQFDKDTSLADIVFPPGTDAEVIARIRGSNSKKELLGFISQLELEMKDKMLHSLTIGDYLKHISQSTGIAYSDSEVANDTAATSRMRQDAMEAIYAKQREASQIRTRIEAGGPQSNSVDDAKALMAVEVELAKTQQTWAEKVALSTPVLESYNAKMERMAQVSGLTAEEFNRLPKSIEAIGKLGDISFNLKGDPESILRGLDAAIQHNQKLLNSWMTPPKEAKRLRLEIEQLTTVAEGLGDAIKESLNFIPSQIARITAAGASFNLSDWFAIDPSVFSDLNLLADKIATLTKAMGKSGISNADFLKASRDLAKAQADFEITQAKAKAEIALQKFDVSGFSSQMSSANSATGVTFDRATYGANKVAIDDLTRQSLGLAAWFEKLPEESKAGLTGFMDEAAQAIKTAAEKLSFNGPDKSAGIAAMLSSAGVSTDKSAMNRLNDSQRQVFANTASAIRDQMKIANDPNSTEAARVAAQKMVDSMSFDLGEAVKLATLKPQETAMYQAGVTFASNMGETLVNGAKDVLLGKKSFKDYVKDISNTFTSGIVNSFMEGMMSPITGENGIIKNMLKDIGSSFFTSGTAVTDKLFGKKASEVDSLAMPLQTQVVTPFQTAVMEFGSYVNTMMMRAGVMPAANQQSFIQPTQQEVASGTPGVSVVGGPIQTPKIEERPLEDIATAQIDGSSMVTDAVTTSAADTSGIFSSSFSKYGQQMMMGFGGLAMSMAAFASGGSGSKTAGWLGLATTVASIYFFGAGGAGAVKKAGGGKVTGPGSGTSDSVAAWLSNGEFVVKAKQAAKYGSLLHAINSDALPAFARGGMVGGMPSMSLLMPMAMPAANDSATGAGSQQVINIDITGDISRQTRQEIIGMLPQIAAGVSRHNYERRSR